MHLFVTYLCFYITIVFVIFFVLLGDLLISLESCDCVVPCHTEHYIPNLSFTFLSELNIARNVLQDPGEKEAVEADFVDSMETLQRAKHEHFTLMDKILREGNYIETKISEASKNIANFSTFSEAYDVIDIFDVGYSDVMDDMEMFNDTINNLAGIIYDQKATFVAHVQPGWRFLNSFSNVSGEIFPFYERFEECLGDGLSDGSSNTTAESPPSENVSGTLDETLDDLLPSVNISVGANGIPSHLGYSNNSLVFASRNCDNDIWLIPNMSYTMIANEEFSFFLQEFREKYIELQLAFPKEVLRNQSAHSQCLKLLDWSSTTGIDALNRYKDLYSDLAVITHEIQNYVTQTEEHIDRSHLSNLVARAFVIATEINTLILSDDMSYFRNIENFPYVEVQEADMADYYYNDGRIFVLPTTFEDGDLRACLWLSNQFVQYQAYGRVPFNSENYINQHKETKDQLRKLVWELSYWQNFYRDLIKPDLEKIASYQNKETEKLVLQNELERVVSYLDYFTMLLNTFKEAINDTTWKIFEDFEIILRLYNITINLSPPLYTYEIMNVTKIGRQLMKHMGSLNTGYNDTDMQRNFSKTFTETLEKHRDVMQNSLYDVYWIIMGNFNDIVKDLATLRQKLYEFKVATTIDSSFYM